MGSTYMKKKHYYTAEGHSRNEMICFAFEMGKLDLVKIPILTNLICKSMH